MTVFLAENTRASVNKPRPQYTRRKGPASINKPIILFAIHELEHYHPKGPCKTRQLQKLISLSSFTAGPSV